MRIGNKNVSIKKIGQLVANDLNYEGITIVREDVFGENHQNLVKSLENVIGSEFDRFLTISAFDDLFLQIEKDIHYLDGEWVYMKIGR